MSPHEFAPDQGVGLSEKFRWILSLDPDDPVIEFEGRWLPRRAMQTVAIRLAHALQTAGVPDDAPIGLIARNRPGQVAAVFAMLAEARPLVMIHAYQSPAALAEEIRRLRLTAVVGDIQDWADADVRDAAREVGSLGFALTQDDVEPLEAVDGLTNLGVRPHAEPTPGVAIAMLTSGTTGAPKRVPIRYSTLEQAVSDAGLATVQGGATSLAAPYIQFYPLGNISGLYGLITCASQGQRIVLLEKFSVDTWVRAVRLYRPTTFMSLPPAGIRMVLDAKVKRDDLSSIPVLRCGSAPLDPDLQTTFERTYGIPILINYGATEFCGVLANWTLDDHRRFSQSKRGSVGRPRPGVSMRVRDVNNNVVLGAGKAGRLEVRAPRISPDWVLTTDLAVIDEDGFLFLRGRSDNMIIRGGFKISPDTIAGVLRDHPSVLEAGVVGVPDPRLGEVPFAAVQLQAGALAPTEAELSALVRSRLSPQMTPVRILVLDTLPRTGSMKVDLGALKTLGGRMLTA